MQKQKTIAKWLSVVLLTTIAIASYLLLTAVNDRPAAENIVSGAEQTPSQEETPPPLVFSSFPRKCEKVQNALVAHVGGGDDEKVLEYAFYHGKTLLFFSTLSIDRDVREKGIYIAVFDEFELEKTIKIFDEKHDYLSSTLCDSGLIVFANGENATKAVILNDELQVCAENEFEKQDVVIHVDNGRGSEFACVKNNVLRIVKIDSSLNRTQDNFVYSGNGISVKHAVSINGKTMLFIQNDKEFKTLRYEQNKGFTSTFFADKSELLQILPIISSNKQAFATLCKTDDSLRLDSFDEDLNHTARYVVKNARKGVLSFKDNNLSLFADKSVYSFCSHIEFLKKIDVSAEFSFEDYVEYFGVDGCPYLFVAKTENGFDLCRFSQDNAIKLTSFSAASSPIVFATGQEENSVDISLLFDANSQNENTYMCFGKNDAFYLSLTTDKT